ncbi:MAG TPA: DNA-processing protein DprA [Acidobacteriaceae bacterium]|nr:DNA-processing protein DprA [Acidobacteriaceae bacterium]
MTIDPTTKNLSEAPASGSAAVAEEEQLAWLALTMTDGLGPRRIWRAVDAAGSAEQVLRLPLTQLEMMKLPAAAAQAIVSGRSRAEADKEWKQVQDSGGALIAPLDGAYPERLREIFDPPTMLWIRGDASLLRQPGIAVVGTRHPTPYGTGMAEMLSRDLAAHGLVILSGMARGVDTAAHRGALDARCQEAAGRTVAVWGTGIDVIYPKENKRLAEQILACGGALLSEYPMGTFPAPQNFPIRNRILSGMSVGVLVIEASENSGTRITARCALEQNREVFAVPGNVTSKNSWGPNTLIKQGAKLVATWEDVWEELPTQIRLEVEDRMGVASLGDPAASLFSKPDLPQDQGQVFEALRLDQSMQLDELVEQLDGKLSSSEIFTALFELELAGRVRAMPGKNYVRTF